MTRLGRILTGYAATVLSMTIGSLLLGLGLGYGKLEFAEIVFGCFVFIAMISVLPFVTCVVIGEGFGVRHWVFYGGCFAGLYLLGTYSFDLLMLLVDKPQSEGLFGRLAFSSAAFAVMGGWVYWAVSGRHAGSVGAGQKGP